MDVTVVADEKPFAEVDGCVGGWFREGARMNDLEVPPGEFLDRALELDLLVVGWIEHFDLVAASRAGHPVAIDGDDLAVDPDVLVGACDGPAYDEAAGCLRVLAPHQLTAFHGVSPHDDEHVAPPKGRSHRCLQ